MKNIFPSLSVCISICLLVLPFLFVSVSHAQVSCGDQSTSDVYQGWTNWCAFACMEFLSKELGCGDFYACEYVNVSCVWKSKQLFPPACGGCCELYEADCSTYYLYTHETDDFMRIIGFKDKALGDLAWLSPGPESEYSAAICAENYLMIAYNETDMNDGHAIVVSAYNPATGEFKIMDPKYGMTRYVTYTQLSAGSYIDGPVSEINYYMKVGNCDLLVGIEDIAAFGYVSQDYQGMVFSYTLAGIASPNDSLAVYISDNPLGPARLIPAYTEKPLDEDPPAEGYVGSFTSARVGYESNYYYYIDFDTGPFDDFRSLSEVFPSDDNPVFWNGGGNGWFPARPILDAPSDISATDIPFDMTYGVVVTWTLSSADTLLDCYNIYRKEEYGDFKYLASAQPGASSYVDIKAIGSTSYMVSSAHRPDGSTSYQGYFGIWNDFSEDAVGRGVHNYFFRDLYTMSDDTLFTCPSGDEDSVLVILTILGSDSLPTVGVPSDSLVLYKIYSDTTYSCEGDTFTSLRDTDQNGTTEFVIKSISGAGIVQLVGHIKGTYLYTDTLSVAINSPDLVLGTSKGVVDILDQAEWATHYLTSCGDANYTWLCDYDTDCNIGLIDFSLFANNWTHGCD